MTRICAWCRAIVGEKCPLCGEEARLMENVNSYVCQNMACEITGFYPGMGGETDTICDECQAKQLPPKRATRASIVAKTAEFVGGVLLVSLALSAILYAWVFPAVIRALGL